MVRGEKDFNYDVAHTCYHSNKCQDTGCRGEDVTHISYIREAMGLEPQVASKVYSQTTKSAVTYLE